VPDIDKRRGKQRMMEGEEKASDMHLRPVRSFWVRLNGVQMLINAQRL
jgi:hypothetical protein